MLTKLIDLFLHLDQHLENIILQFGWWTYLILFLVIFAETGFVVTPFLPGDSLLFAAGALASLGSLNIWILYIAMLLGAIIGDSVNYQIGHYIGPKALKINNKFIKKEHIEKTQKFYEKHGGFTIILARFIPIIRTFAPFVAGIGTMDYKKFITYNIIGAVAWVTSFLFAGYFFGNLPFIKENFHYTVLIIIIISFIPIGLEIYKAKFSKKRINS